VGLAVAPGLTARRLIQAGDAVGGPESCGISAATGVKAARMHTAQRVIPRAGNAEALSCNAAQRVPLSIVVGLHMTVTGAFKILSFEMIDVAGSPHKVVDCVSAQCLRRSHVTTITDGAIHHLTGGLVIRCANCGREQAVANGGLSHGG